MRHSRPGWNLLELVVVMAILGILTAVTMVWVARTWESANRTTCLDNLRQLALAVHSYHDDQKSLPPYASKLPESRILGGWWIHLMPYADQQSCYDRILGCSQGISSGPGKTLLMPAVQQDGIRDVRFQLLTCPSDPSGSVGSDWLDWVGTSNYLANWYVFGNGVRDCYGDPRKFRDVADGLSNTVLFAEGYAYCDGMVRPALTVCCSHNFGITPLYLPSDDPSYLPNDYTMFQIRPSVMGPGGCDFWRTQTPHDAMPVALADGTARFLPPVLSPSLWKQLLKPTDGGPGGDEW